MFFTARHLLTSACLVLCSSLALANASINSSTTLVQRPKKDTSIFSGFFNVARSTNLYDFQDGTRGDGVAYLGRLNANLGSSFTLRVDGGYNQDLKDSTKNDFADTVISLRSTPMNLGKTFLFSYNAGFAAPTSKVSSEVQGMYASARAGAVLAINSNRLIKGFSVVSSIVVARNFHEFETSKVGAVNNQYSSTQSLSLNYDFPRNFSISADIVHKNAISYQGILKEAYEISEELSYQVNSNFGIAVGHSNSGNALRPNGQDYSFDAYNENTSVVYASMTVIF